MLLAGNHENKEPSKDTDSKLIFPKLCESNSNDIGDKKSIKCWLFDRSSCWSVGQLCSPSSPCACLLPDNPGQSCYATEVSMPVSTALNTTRPCLTKP